MTRKNPKRSGGPQNPEGKVVASQNAIKTGTYSNLPLLSNEDPEEFNQLLDYFFHDFQPADMIETSLVRDLAVIAWKRMRLEKLQNDYFIKKSNSPIKLEELIDAGLKFNKNRYDFWIKDQKLDETQLKNVRDTLALIKPIMRVGITDEQLLEIKTLNPPLHASVVDFYRRIDPLALPDLSESDLVEMTFKFPNQPEQFITSIVFEQYITHCEAALWCTEHQVKIDEAVSQIKQERILKLMQSDGNRRPDDDLSRSFVRTLAEYRKHNQWRMQNRVVDVKKDAE